jgi:alpha-glucoside transport system permease protein
MTVVCALWCVPTIGALVNSFRTIDATNTSGWWTVFGRLNPLDGLTISGYRAALTGPQGFGTAFINSLAITLPATLLPLLVAAFAAYALVFMRMPGRSFMFGLLVTMLIIPNYVTFLPLLKLYTALGLQGKFVTVWLAETAFGLPLAVYIIRAQLVSMPRQIIDCARVDGATDFQTFWRVVLPLSAPSLAAYAIFQFLTVWNDLLVPLVFIGQGPNNPLPVALAAGQITTSFEQLSAGAVIAEIVPVVVFITLQRYFVRGLTTVWQ